MKLKSVLLAFSVHLCILPLAVRGAAIKPANTKFSYTDITRDYDYMPKFRWMRDNLPYVSFFMSWDRLRGPYGRGTPDSVKEMYNDPVVANRNEINWRSRPAESKGNHDR